MSIKTVGRKGPFEVEPLNWKAPATAPQTLAPRAMNDTSATAESSKDEELLQKQA